MIRKNVQVKINKKKNCFNNCDYSGTRNTISIYNSCEDNFLYQYIRIYVNKADNSIIHIYVQVTLPLSSIILNDRDLKACKMSICPNIFNDTIYFRYVLCH